MSFWNRKKSETGGNSREIVGEGKEFIIVEDGQVDRDNYNRSFDKKELSRHLSEPSPRFGDKSADENIDFKRDYEKWVGFRKSIAQASEIVVCGHHDGLGDSIHHIRYALAFAENFPDKRITFLVRNPELFDLTKLPPNVEVRKTNSKEVYIDDPETQTTSEVVIFNPAIFQPIIRSQFGGKDSKFVFAETQRQKEGREIFSTWHYAMVPIDDKPNQQLRDMQMSSKNNLYFTYSAHQLLDQASKLKYLLGMKVPENFDVVPLAEPEGEPGDNSDVIIVCDAAEGDKAKLVDPDTWAKVIVDLFNENGDEFRIKIVEGLSNPDLVESIIRALPDYVKKNNKIDFPRLEKLITSIRENVIRTSLTGLVQEFATTRLVLSTDTGPGHIINELIRKKRSEGKDSPKLLSVFGLGPYNPLFFRLDCGASIIGNEKARDIKPDAIAKVAQKMLSAA
jgi:hypothetical protein